MRKRKNSGALQAGESLRHPLRRHGHLTLWMAHRAVVILALLALGLAMAAAAADEKKGSEKLGFLLFGTVFTREGRILSAAEIEIKVASGKKPKWKARSDVRGEFAVRVPYGAEYELRVAAKGYQEQQKKVDARSGSRADLIFRLDPTAGGKQQ